MPIASKMFLGRSAIRRGGGCSICWWRRTFVKRFRGHFQMSRPAVSQHLRVLLDAGLVTEQRHGRERRYRFVPERLGPVRDWIAVRAVLG